MKETMKRELNKTYLILSSEDTAYEESYEIEMINKNDPQILLPLHVVRLNGQIQLFYDISSKQTVKEWGIRNKFSAEIISSLFEAIEQLRKEMINFLLDMECVVLDLDHIYLQEDMFYFCYCPWERKEVLPSVRELLENILGNLDYKDSEAVELTYHLYQQSCKGNFYIPQIIEEHCKKEQKEFSSETVPCTSVEDSCIEEKTVIQEQFAKRKSIWNRIVQFFSKKKANVTEASAHTSLETYENTVYENNIQTGWVESSVNMESSTILLEHMPMGIWKLRPIVSEYKEFWIRQDNFFIGKSQGQVDGCIERDTVSRIHSRLSVKNGRLYVSDINSTNGTFVNGQTVLPGKDVEIFPGDRILFADVEYECYNSL